MSDSTKPDLATKADLAHKEMVTLVRPQMALELQACMQDVAATLGANVPEAVIAAIRLAALGIYYMPKEEKDIDALVAAAHLALDAAVKGVRSGIASGLLPSYDVQTKKADDADAKRKAQMAHEQEMRDRAAKIYSGDIRLGTRH